MVYDSIQSIAQRFIFFNTIVGYNFVFFFTVELVDITLYIFSRILSHYLSFSNFSHLLDILKLLIRSIVLSITLFLTQLSIRVNNINY